MDASTSSRPSKRFGHLYVLYLSISLGVVLWYMVYYPESLFYGLPTTDLTSFDTFLIADDPFIALLLCMALSLLAHHVIGYMAFGRFNFAMLGKDRATSKDAGQYETYLAWYSHALTPLFLVVPLCYVRFVFFERILFFSFFFPMFDLTTINVVFFILYGSIIAWRMLIEFRINSTFFKPTRRKAIIPVLFQTAIIVLITVVPLLLFGGGWR